MTGIVTKMKNVAKKHYGKDLECNTKDANKLACASARALELVQ